MFAARRLVASADSRQPWEIAGARLEKTFSLAAQGGAPTAIVFKPDGTKFFVTDPVLRNIREYSLSTAWDIATASYVRQVSFSESFTPSCLAFRPDGTNMYLTQAGTSATGHPVFGYSLSTAWSLSPTPTYTYLSDPLPAGLAVSGFCFNDAGTRLYVSSTPNETREYTLPSAWSVSSFTESAFLALGSYTGIGAIQLADSESRAYVPFTQGPAGGLIWSRSLATPGVWSSASTVRELSVGGTAAGVVVGQDGKKMFVLNSVSNDSSIRQYSLAPSGGGGAGPTDPFWNNVSLLLRMDGSNGSTTFTDSSSNALSVTAVGNAQISTAQAKFGQSGLFDGSGDYLSIANNAVFDVGSANFTLECWVRPTTSTAGLRLLYVKRTSGVAHMALGINNGNFTFWAATATSSWDVVNGVTFGAASLNTWHHVAVVRNGNSFTGYLNGVGTSLATSSATIGSGSTAAVTIGGEPAGNAFSGNIDDYRVTRAARYTANFTPPTAAFPTS